MALVAILAGASAYAYLEVVGKPNECAPLGGAKVLKSTVTPTTFGAVTEWSLPSPARWPNSATVAPDGSVWFGEQSVPGVGHLFANGTLVEYAWPWSSAQGVDECGYRTGVWGVVLWNGMVWASSFDSNQIFGLDPHTDTTVALNVTSPYNLTAGPDGDLWFTAETYNYGRIGRVSPNLTVSVYDLLEPYNDYIPQQIAFVNSTYAYFVALDPSSPAPDVYASGLFSFDPENVSQGIDATLLSSGQSLFATTSLGVGGGTVWIAEHDQSAVVGYNISTGQFTSYPTSVDNFTAQETTLPYFMSANGTLLWFSEHYANSIALLNQAKGTLTEYSEADPPVYNLTDIGNDETVAQSKDGLWFVSQTGNYIGFVNATVSPGFSIATLGSSALVLSQGGNATVQLELEGSWTKALDVKFSDSENITSVPSKIAISSQTSVVEPGGGPVEIAVELRAATDLQPGRYTVLVTVTDGLVSQSAYLFVDVPG